jgi:Flp pilus assembly protein TadG
LRLPPIFRDERGATLVMVVVTLLVLLGVSAIVIDLSAVRSDRSAEQKVTDSAAASAALAAVDGNGRDACRAALAYVVVNSREIASLDDSGCVSAFSASCVANRPESHVVTAGRYTITITYPVTDDHPLMTSGQIGAPTQTLVVSDGIACERVGVHMQSTHRSQFGQLMGFGESTTNVHTVATAGLPGGGGAPINLLVLNRTACQTIETGGQAVVIVDAIVNPDGGGPGVPALQQGVAAADSNGSGCGSNRGTIHVGANAEVRADGAAGCANQTGTQAMGPSLLKGLGCGLVMTYAPGTPGCNVPACSDVGGTINPLPTGLPARLTRAPVDHRYNCRADYTTIPSSLSWATAPLTVANGQDIPGCTDHATRPPHIHELITTVGQSGMPVGFQRWGAVYGCSLPSSQAPIDVSGNWWIDCSSGGGFSVNSHVTIRGNVVFDRDVSIGASGHLKVLNALGSPGYVFLRNGELSKAGQGSLTFQYTTVYASKTSSIKMSGGSGSMIWVAPDLEGHKFDDLALWSDSAGNHSWAGQANLVMEGVFFSPLATASYSGTGGQATSNAQWIADKLNVSGQGVLIVRPAFGRSVEFPVQPRTTLIR